MTAPGSLTALVAGLLRAVTQVAVAHVSLSGPWGSWGLSALAATVLAGAALAAVLALLTSLARASRTAAIPVFRRVSGMREKSWRAAFLRQRDPDAAGRARPRAPSAARAAATSA
jgi:Family of unknown function (DUF6412)